MSINCKLDIYNENFENNIDFLKAISDKNRLKIICFLKGGEKCVCDIIDFIELPQNLVSHHLRKLRDANIVNANKVGLKVIYNINEKYLNQNINFLKSLLIK